MNEKFTGKTAELQNKLKKGLETLDETILGELSASSSEKKSLALRNQQLKTANKKIKKMIKSGNESFGSSLFATGLFTVFGISQLISEGAAESNAGLMLFLALSFGIGTYFAYQKKERGKRIMKYFSILNQGRAKIYTVDKLAEITSYAPKQICKDLDVMLEEEILKDGFLDRINGTLVLENVSDYLEHYTYPAQEDPTPFAEHVEHETLREIRKINQNIQNPTLSKQIDHITMITGKILDFQAKNNTKDQELHSFLSYYLPTTQKVLTFYSELEAQNIEGDNITKAKQEIEDMMAKVVEGFEKQLDQLFQNETMDIVTDIQVLEQMFEKNGLTSPFSKQNGKSGVKNDPNDNISLKL